VIVKLQGNATNNDVYVQVDPTHDALRASFRPWDHVPLDGTGPIGGHYAIDANTGTMAANIASAAQVFQVRWGDSTKLFILKKLVVSFATLTGFASTGLGCPVELILGHGSTASGSGGTGIAPSSASNKSRATMASSCFTSSGEIRIASTAALTAAGSQTLEAAGLASCAGASATTNITAGPYILWDMSSAGEHPIILGPGAGDTLVIRTVNPGSTGTWSMFVSMSWAEFTNF
jgi:hypothetical protein